MKSKIILWASIECDSGPIQIPKETKQLTESEKAACKKIMKKFIDQHPNFLK